MNEKKRVWKHVTANTTQKTIRWPFKQLEDAEKCSEILGITVSDFIRTATQEKIDKTIRKDPEDTEENAE